MELGEIIEISIKKMIESQNAFRDGQHDVAKSCIMEVNNFLQMVSPESDISELADTAIHIQEGLNDQECSDQDLAGNESMLNFSQHMNRILYLTTQILANMKENNFQKVRINLGNIHAHANAAQQQMDRFQWFHSQGGISSEGFGL